MYFTRHDLRDTKSYYLEYILLWKNTLDHVHVHIHFSIQHIILLDRGCQRSNQLRTNIKMWRKELLYRVAWAHFDLFIGPSHPSIYSTSEGARRALSRGTPVLQRSYCSVAGRRLSIISQGRYFVPSHQVELGQAKQAYPQTHAINSFVICYSHNFVIEVKPSASSIWVSICSVHRITSFKSFNKRKEKVSHLTHSHKENHNLTPVVPLQPQTSPKLFLLFSLLHIPQNLTVLVIALQHLINAVSLTARRSLGNVR